MWFTYFCKIMHGSVDLKQTSLVQHMSEGNLWLLFAFLIYFVHWVFLLVQEEAILRAQELENAVSDADYTKAIQLAFELRRPHKLFDLFSRLCRLATINVPLFCLLSIPTNICGVVQEKRCWRPNREGSWWSWKGRNPCASWICTGMEHKAQTVSCCTGGAFSNVQNLSSDWHCGGIFLPSEMFARSKATTMVFTLWWINDKLLFNLF